MFGGPPPLPLITEYWEKDFTVKKYTVSNFQDFKKVYVSFKIFMLFFNCCCQHLYISILV